MSEPVTITSLETSDFKRLRALELTPDAAGLTIIGGRCAQGKTSVLDAICYLLGAGKFKPGNPNRHRVAPESGEAQASLSLTLSNGLTVERKGKNASLRVTDPNGRKSGQDLLNSFVSELSLNLPKFMAATAKGKADTVLKILGVGDQLEAAETAISDAEAARTLANREAKRLALHVESLPSHPERGVKEVSVAELSKKLEEAQAHNEACRELERNAVAQSAAAQSAAEKRAAIWAKREGVMKEIATLTAKAKELNEEFMGAADDIAAAEADAEKAAKASEEQTMSDVAPILAAIESAESDNAKARANKQFAAAADDSRAAQKGANDCDARVQTARAGRAALLDGAQMPLDGLTIEHGELLYKSVGWDCMSGAEQLRVATSIVRKLNPECGFVLVDELERMDVDTLREFGEWAQTEGLQIIGTRVSTGDECSLIIEDGQIQE